MFSIFLTEKCLKIGGGHVIGAALHPAPFHEQAVGQPSKHPENPDAVVALHPAAILIIGDVQSLMESAFDSPARPVGPKPLLGVETFGRGTGDQSDFFIFASGGLPQEPRSLARQGKAHIFGVDFGRGDGAVFCPAFVLFAGARLPRSGFIQGGNPLGER